MRWSACLVAALVAACGEDGPPLVSATDGGGLDAGVAVDLGPADAGTEARIRVGTGTSRFRALPSDPIHELVVGPQGGGRFGGLHVLVAVELVDVTPGELELIEVRLLDEDGGERAFLARDPALTPFVAQRELPGLTPRIDDCCRVAERPLTVDAVATTVDGRVLRASAPGTASACPPTGPSLCE